MPFADSDTFRALNHLNKALWRSATMRETYQDYDGRFFNFNATLNPTEYQGNQPVPILFEENDIRDRLNKIQAKSEYQVQQVIQVLDDLDKLEKGLKTERSSVNAALKRADTVEWFEGQRTGGMESQRDASVEDLRYYLGLPPTAPPRGGGAVLNRS